MCKRRRSIVLALLTGLVALVVLVLVVALAGAHTLERRLHRATADLGAGRLDAARNSLNVLALDSWRLDGHLRGPLPAVLARVPLAGRSVRTARTVLETGADAALVAERVLPLLEQRPFWRAGAVDISSLHDFRDIARQQRPRIAADLLRIERSPSWPLPGPLGRARRQIADRLAAALHSIDVSSRAIDLSDSVLGAQSFRRYFIAFENPDELRGAGGLWGNYGIVDADHGTLHLGAFGRTGDLTPFATHPGPDWYEARYSRFGASADFHQITSAPDFPTVAALAETDLARSPDITHLDGTIAIDPEGLAALLRVTGPVRVPSWPQPIDASSVVRTTLHDAYAHFQTNTERVAFLGDTALAVWSQLLRSHITAATLARSQLGDAVRGKHLRMHFTRPDEEALAVALGADGSVGDPRTTIGLVTQNESGHKMDYWLDRTLRVTLDLHPDGTASGQATIALRNNGPASGEPRYVIGPFDPSFKAGWNKQLIRLYLPASTVVRLGDTEAGIAAEQGFVVVEWEVDVPPGGRVERTVSFDVTHAWNPHSGRADITIRKQASVRPDDASVAIEPPWGWRLRLPDPSACPRGPVTGDVRLNVSATHWWPGWILGPWARHVACGAHNSLTLQQGGD